MSNQGERKKGIQIHRSIVYGSCARLLTPSEAALAPPGHSHRWFVFLASAATPPPRFKPGRPPKGVVPGPDDVLDEDIDWMTGGADDLSWLIKRVVFKLHDTYPSPNRAIDKPPFAVSETGWGEFPLSIRITFAPETGEKTLSLTHNLKLHHWGPAVQGPVAPVGAIAVAAAQEGEGEGEGEGSVDGGGSGGVGLSGGAEVENEKKQKEGRAESGSQKEASGAGTEPNTPAGTVDVDMDADGEPDAEDAEGEVDTSASAAVSVAGDADKATGGGGGGYGAADTEADAEGEADADADGEADAEAEGEDDIEIEAEADGTGTRSGSTSVVGGGERRLKNENGSGNGNEMGNGNNGDAMDIDAPESSTQPDAALEGKPQSSDPDDTSTPATNPLPVHSWQYDQLVFSDPTQTFYDLLLAHPETPLPAKSLRRGAAEGEGAILERDRGSAGVPMEFTRGLERGEEERLERARRELVMETDRWRQKLIDLEREAQQLKDEIAAGIV